MRVSRADGNSKQRLDMSVSHVEGNLRPFGDMQFATKWPDRDNWTDIAKDFVKATLTQAMWTRVGSACLSASFKLGRKSDHLNHVATSHNIGEVSTYPGRACAQQWRVDWKRLAGARSKIFRRGLSK